MIFHYFSHKYDVIAACTIGFFSVCVIEEARDTPILKPYFKNISLKQIICAAINETELSKDLEKKSLTNKSLVKY